MRSALRPGGDELDLPVLEHKFSVGEIVETRVGQIGMSALGRFEVVRLLPPTGTSNQYRLKSLIDGRERVLREEELVRDGG